MNLQPLLIFILVSVPFTEGLSYLVTNSQLFQPWRNLVGNIGQRLNLIDKSGTNYMEYMVYCHLCTSHQIAIFVSLFQPLVQFFPTSIPLLNVLITSIVVGRTAYILFNIYEVLTTWINKNMAGN